MRPLFLEQKRGENHNFLVHCQMGGRQPIEDKPIRKSYLDKNLQRFCITFSEHGDHYDFYDLREIVSEFLTVFENVFVPRAHLRWVRFKCSYTIINRQPSPRPGFIEITDSRIWQTNVYDGVYFNEYVESNLAQDIFKRIIMNGRTSVTVN